MIRKLSEYKIELIKKLYNNGSGISIKEIGEQTGVSYSVVYSYTRVKQRINPETGKKFKSTSEYQDYRARQKINPETEKKFKSCIEYENYRIRQKINPETGKKYKSCIEYENYRIRQKINPETEKKFKSSVEYRNYRIRQKINPETGKKYKSCMEYENYRARQRSKRKTNKKLSKLIIKRLEELKKNLPWLASEIGVSYSSANDYVHGKSIPKGETLSKLLNILKPDKDKKRKPKFLDELLEDLIKL